VQVGGGVRGEADAEALWAAGVRRVVLGTAALERPELVAWAVRTAGPEAVAVALDARGLRLATRGWRAETDAQLLDVAPRFVDLGVRTLVYTDIERDGMLVGPNLLLAERLADTSGADVVVAGGIASATDVAAVAEVARRQRRVRGVVLGRALYDGRLELTALRAWRDAIAPAS
jgi:phosphoribosylformimino-5-aminoimidazole carboxamide ribotide isomerase